MVLLRTMFPTRANAPSRATRKNTTKPCIDGANETSETPLHAATKGGHVGCLRILLDGGADVNKPGPGGMTALHVACQHRHVACIRELVRRGADRGRRDDLGRVPIQLPAQETGTPFKEEPKA